MANFLSKIIQRLTNHKKDIDKAQRAATESMLGFIEGEMKQRIHFRGEAYVGQIGKYRSVDYKKKRVAAGRQVTKKDLVFKGNLIRSYGVGDYRGTRILGFFTERYRIIAEGQHVQTGKIIFRARPETIQKGKEHYLRTYKKVLGI